MKKFHVKALPVDLKQSLESNGCTVPKHCFANCALAVTNFNIGEKYVLCFVVIAGGKQQPHALIKVNQEYFDPTLEPQNLKADYYLLHKELSKTELIAFVRNWYKDKKPNALGEMEVYPPALLHDGKIVCVEINA